MCLRGGAATEAAPPDGRPGRLGGAAHMSQKKKKISYFSASVSSTISVALVLLLVGIVALAGVTATQVTGKIKESIGLSVSAREGATDEQIAALKRQISCSPYVSAVKHVSRQEAMEQWKRETGEDLVETLGFNPLTDEFEVRVRAEYSSVDSLMAIEKRLATHPAVDEVQIHRDQVEAVQAGLRKAAALLLAVAVALLVISLALINNTVRMTVYSTRFLIYTMKLVGATPGYIRRPIVVSNMMGGVLSALIAIAALAGIVYYASTDGDIGAEIVALLPVEAMAAVAGALVVAGAALCSLAALLAANKYIRLDYDKLF